MPVTLDWGGRSVEESLLLSVISSFSVPVTLDWGDRSVEETVFWFQHESDPSLNSNAFDIAHLLVQKHYPGN